MKKIVAAIITIIIIASVVFAFGYVPFRTDPEGRYVLYSQSSGWQNIVPGERTVDWRWQLLVPRNVVFYRFDDVERLIHLSLSDSLPSAELYRDYVPGSPDFSTTIEIDLVIGVPSSSLANLSAAGLRPDGLDDWFDRTASQITQTASTVVRQEASQIGDSLVTDLFSVITDSLTNSISDRYPEIVVRSIVPVRLSFPDISLYQTARESYRSVQAATQTALSEAAIASAEETIRSQQITETFSQYGEILTEYPVLLEYLNIVAEHGGDPLSITVPLQ